jgi:aspartate 1-decarboxylase
MLIEVCTAKVHRARVTHANLAYVGSVTIDQNILDAAGIAEFQMVNVNNLANGTQWQTYVLSGTPGEGEICLNGPPARHFLPGDLVIVLAKGLMEPVEMSGFEPNVVFVDEHNRVTGVKPHGEAKNVL